MQCVCYHKKKLFSTIIFLSKFEIFLNSLLQTKDFCLKKKKEFSDFIMQLYFYATFFLKNKI